MEFFEGILKLATDLTDTLSAGGPKTIIFIILLNFAVGLVVVRQLAKLIMTHYQEQIAGRDAEIKRLNGEIEKKDKLLDERFEMFKELTQSHMGISKEFSNSMRSIELGITEMRVHFEGQRAAVTYQAERRDRDRDRDRDR